MTVDTGSTDSARRVEPDLHVLRVAAVAALAGAVAGLVVGGVGGRLAMRVLALTSPAHLRGLRTDDQAVVGVVSTETLFLLVLTTVLGAVAGTAYFAIRPVLPASTRARTWLFAALTGAVGGALLLHDSTSFDFGLLRPQWFAVAAFVAIPALAGALTARSTERWSRVPTDTRWAGALLAAGVLALLVAFPVSVPVLVAAVAVTQVRAVRRAASHPAVAATALVVLALVTAWGLYGIAADVVSIATDRPSTAPMSP